jgi:hypothetical protein
VGDQYLRKLLIVGLTVLVRNARYKPERIESFKPNNEITVDGDAHGQDGPLSVIVRSPVIYPRRATSLKPPAKLALRAATITAAIAADLPALRRDADQHALSKRSPL